MKIHPSDHAGARRGSRRARADARSTTPASASAAAPTRTASSPTPADANARSCGEPGVYGASELLIMLGLR